MSLTPPLKTLAGAIFDSRLDQTLPPGFQASTVLQLVRSLQLANLHSRTVHALSLSIQVRYQRQRPLDLIARS